MLKKDSLAAQMQQLGYTLAKAKRLILDGEVAEGEEVLKEALAGHFNTNITELLETPANVFIQRVRDERFAAAELGLLADFMDELASTLAEKPAKNILLEKVLLIYDLLEQEYQTVSFAHLARRTEITAMLSH